MKSSCGLDCAKCEWGNDCKGCAETGGNPFGGGCVVKKCDPEGKSALEVWKGKLIRAIHALAIPDMAEVTDLNMLKGSFINLEYTLPGGQKAKIWDDNKIYVGNQLHKKGSDRCYGIVADEEYLMVAEYGDYGSDARIIVLKRWAE